MNFVKMHGLGNDFVIVDCLSVLPNFNPSETAIRVCSRNFGIGADGLVMIFPSQGRDARMRIFNPDGSEPEMCGNAIRCVAKYLRDSGAVKGEKLVVETLAGDMQINIKENGISVDMGAPRETGRAKILIDSQAADFMLVSTGNPHAVTYAINPSDEVFFKYGPRIEHNPRFPEGTNVEFCECNSRNHIKVRVWERGAGATLACGTGATASFFAGVRTGLIDKHAIVTLPGGDLIFDYLDNGHVIMTGPATEVFRGTLDL